MNLIIQISTLDNDESLRRMENVADSLKNPATDGQLELVKKLAKPMRKKTDIDELIKEQNWKPVNPEEFDRLIKEIDIQEPLEQLIADIGK